MIRKLLIIAIGGACAGCVQMSSSEFKTSELIAHLTVQGWAPGNSVTCNASFTNAESSDYVELGNDDLVICNGAAMIKSGPFYSVTTTYAPGETYTISLVRSAVSVFAAKVVLPPAPSSISPASATKGLSLTVTWDSTGTDPSDSMEVSLDNAQYGTNPLWQTLTDDAPEDGAITFTGSQTQTTPPVAGLWNGYLRLTRRRMGTMPERLQGTIEGSNATHTNFILND